MQLYYELTVTTLLQNDIGFTESGEKIANLISAAMHLDNELAAKHVQRGYKHYVFNNLYPIEADKVYKAGRAYIFKLRSPDAGFINKLKGLLYHVDSTEFEIMAVAVKSKKISFIEKITTITPVVITVDDKNWVSGDDVMLLMNRLHANLEKKYKAFYNEEPEAVQNFAHRMEILNKKPIAHKYKNIKMIGNKLCIWVNDDEASQKLAFTAMVCGLGEKNSSAGMGFCIEGR